MEGMHERPSEDEEVFEQNIRHKKEYEGKIQQFEEAGVDIQCAFKNAIDRATSRQIELEAMFPITGSVTTVEEGMELVELIRGPQGKDSRADFYSCSYCGKASPTKLQACGRCKKPSYCYAECQHAA